MQFVLELRRHQQRRVPFVRPPLPILLRRIVAAFRGLVCLIAAALSGASGSLAEAEDRKAGAKSATTPVGDVETFLVAGVDFPRAFSFGDTTLLLIGSGVRKQLRLDMYAIALYGAGDVQSDKDIIERDHPTVIRVELVSNLATKDRFERAVTQSFQKLTAGMPNRLEAEIAAFVGAFVDPFQKTDVFEFVYQPGVGTHVIKNGDVKTTVKGSEFKQALLAIWIGESPIDELLKSDLLAGVKSESLPRADVEEVHVDSAPSRIEAQRD